VDKLPWKFGVHNELRFQTGETPGGMVVQTMDVLGTVTQRFFNAAHAEFEDSIRNALITCGWTPPSPSPPAEVARVEARWYCVANYGGATLCVDEGDARREAKTNDQLHPHNAPHVAVRMAPINLLKTGEEFIAKVEAWHWHQASCEAWNMNKHPITMAGWRWIEQRATALAEIEQRAKALSEEGG
jgi:hypothetical protein